MPRIGQIYVLICAFVLQNFAVVPQGEAQITDSNAPYEDAYDVQTRGELVGAWHGTISGSSISQGDGQMAGQAVFVQRGYEGRNTFAVVLHDHRHRNGLDYSEIAIGNIPCGPDDGDLKAVDPVELQNAPEGFASVRFINHLADTRRNDFEVGVGGWYGAELDRPVSLLTRWSDDGFTLKLTGPFASLVAPVRSHTFDYERQRETYLDHIHLDVEFTLEIGPETQAAFDSTLCKEPEVFEVIDTTPRHGRENVILEGADFFIEFSDAVAQSSLDSSTVTMTTRDPKDGFIFVDLELALEDEHGVEDGRSLRIMPREPLRSGTIYEISVAGGETGLRGSQRQVLEADYTFSISTMVAPDDLRFGIYQVSRNAPLVYGKPAAARIEIEWEELEDIHPEWQVLDYPVQAAVLDDRDKTVFPELQRRIERPDQFTDEDRRLGEHTLNLFGWTPSEQNNPRYFRAEITPDNHYPADFEIAPAIIEQTLDYATQSVDLLTFDYYIAAHSEWRDNIDIEQSRQIVQAARQDQVFANQILPVARVRGRFKGTYNLQDTMCSIPGVEWVACEDGFHFWDNPASQAADLNNWNALVRLFHEHVAAHSDADILVSYHPPSLGGSGIARTPFEQPESLHRRGDEPFWFGKPDPHPIDSLHGDRAGQNTIIMSTATPDDRMFPGILLYPLVAHEFGHVFGLPHTPFAESAQHRHEICQSGYKTVAPGIDGMRIALDGENGWQKSSEHGNAQTRKPLLNLMFPCIHEPHVDYWIDPNQYNWLIERMPEMLRYTRGRRAEAPLVSRVRLAQVSEPLEGPAIRNDADPALPAARWIMLSGMIDGDEATLMPAIGVPRSRPPLSGDGPYELQVEDAAGRIIARTSLGPGSSAERPWPFAVTVPVSGEPARIVLLRESEVLTERRGHPALAPPAVRSHLPDKTYRAGETLKWGDASSGELTYSVRFTANGRDWTTLAVLLSEPYFTPDPATLRPGENPAFEFIAHDGVTERVTQLPVQIDVPLVPLAVWAEAETAASANIAFNVPLDDSTLGAIALEADGEAVPAEIALDPSGMVLLIAPQALADDVTYTVTVAETLRAEDGRSLADALSFAFSPQSSSAVGSEAARHSAQADYSEVSENDDHNPVSAAVGVGEITLQLGEMRTVAARILRCETEDDGSLLHLEMDFETMPGDRVDVILSRIDETILSAEMTLSNGKVIKAVGTVQDGWLYQASGEQVTARGHVGVASNRTEFSLTGECP
ncbi:Ig-like domain-containing protein [Pontibaca salina]|uniref:Ig-like domain-containing protein n=1 Tax=Pontibaca salina TaxID=2795731 RepID=A0A934HUI2_9RHOB|nr:Ig-like domain-containing protein [Pontibaca salina]MBI6630765.1 Ig-like domain-containing protein [Pontibaca salina]